MRKSARSTIDVTTANVSAISNRSGTPHDRYCLSAAKRLAGLIRRRKIGCLELLNHYLDRVERFNPALNAIISTDIPAARRRARTADKMVAKGDKLGPLHGVPMTVKESFDVKGLPTSWGVPDQKNSIAARDAVSVQRLRAAGANVFGKTNIPIWLADCQSFNANYGRTSNPLELRPHTGRFIRRIGGGAGGGPDRVRDGQRYRRVHP